MDSQAEIEMLRDWLAAALGVIQEGRQIGSYSLLPHLEDYLFSKGVLTAEDLPPNEYGTRFTGKPWDESMTAPYAYPKDLK